MFFAIVIALLIAGLCCLWIALVNLSRTATRETLVVRPVPRPDQPKPRLTRLGRPIEPVQH